MLQDNRELTRITITAFKDKRLQSKDSEFVIPTNPEQYTQNYKVELDTSRGQGNQGTDLKFKSTAPEQLKLDFILDGTKTIEGYGYPKMTVTEQVKKLLEVVYDMSGEIHQPHYLKVLWGENGFTTKPHAFDCILGNLDINYLLFSRNGEPLRAKISATFINYIEQEARVRRENKKSPDLTHIRTVNDGDKLPQLTFDVYSDQSYYLKVAKTNGLTSFRKLRAGEELMFPPIEK